MNSRNHNMLDDDRIGRLLVKLALPAFLGMFVMALYNVVDTIFIGRYVGPLGIAGLSIIFPFQMISMGVGHMTGMGGASLISRMIGSNDIPKANHALGNAFISNIYLAVLIAIIGLINTDFWVGLLGASESIHPYAKDYLTIILFGLFFQNMAMSLNFLIRAEGNARVPMTGMIIGAVANIILDAVLIVVFEMGVQGAALATVIAQFFSVVYFLSFYFSRSSYLKLRMKYLVIKWSILKPILSIGVAAFAMTMAGSISAIFVNHLLVDYGGDLAVSAFGVVHRIMMFAGLPGIVIGQGLQPILGFNYGARRFDRAYRAIKLSLISATVLCLGIYIVLFFFPDPFISMFTIDAELIAISVHVAKRIFLVLYLMGFIMIGGTIFQATGKAVQAFVTSTARPVLFLLPLLFILPRFLQMDGILLAFPITDVLAFILTLVLALPIILMFRRLGAPQTGPIQTQPEADQP